jgi:hypothetical protein
MVLTLSALAGFYVAVPMANYTAQMIALIVGSLSFYSWGVLVLRWSALVVPPALIGTSSGLVFLSGGVVQIVAQGTAGQLAGLLGFSDDTTAGFYAYPAIAYGTIGILFGALAVAVLFFSPPAAYIKRGHRKRASLIESESSTGGRSSFVYGAAGDNPQQSESLEHLPKCECDYVATSESLHKRAETFNTRSNGVGRPAGGGPDEATEILLIQ